MNELDQIKTSYEIKSNDDVIRLNLVLRKTIELEKKICDRIDPEIANAYKTHKGLTALKKEELQPILNVKNAINDSLKQWQIKLDNEAKALQEKVNKQLAEQAEQNWSDEKPDTVDLYACKQAVIPKVEGQYKRSNWKARVINAELVPKEFWIINESALDKTAKLTKGEIEIPGVEFYDDFTIVTKM